jgi:hypothetical protein
MTNLDENLSVYSTTVPSTVHYFFFFKFFKFSKVKI